MGSFYTINKYITLKLEEGKTVIYVGGEKFRVCRAIPISIPENNIQDVQSVDDLLEIRKVLKDQEINNEGITAETEFLVNCSNLQAWAENGYNTDLMDSRIAFPLLKRLAELGDKTAKSIFKEEIIRRYKNGTFNSQLFLKDEGYLDTLTEEELISGAMETREYILFSEIVNFMKKYGVRYELVQWLDEDKCRHRLDGRKRFFSLYKGHICEFEFDFFEESYFLFEKLSEFKDLDWLVLITTRVHTAPLSGEISKINSLRVLKLKLVENSEIPDIFSMTPNIKLLIIINHGLKGRALKYVNSIDSLKLLNELDIYRYTVNPDDLSKLKSRGIKILIR